jgi:hypothetical protein
MKREADTLKNLANRQDFICIYMNASYEYKYLFGRLAGHAKDYAESMASLFIASASRYQGIDQDVCGNYLKCII